MDFKSHVHTWLTFSKKERTGIFVLFTIAMLLWILPVFFSRSDVPDAVLRISPVVYESAQTIIIANQSKDAQNRKEWKVYPQKTNPARGFSATSINKIDINTADSAAFERLPGIGEKLSSRIIKYRERLGGFVAVAQLQDVYGLSDSTYQIIRPRVEMKSGFKPRLIPVNSADYMVFRRHPYVQSATLKAVLAYRKAHGKIISFTEYKGIAMQVGDSTVDLLEPYLDFSG
jgi:competence ComEA-like helix-hairpin-helix protein